MVFEFAGVGQRYSQGMAYPGGHQPRRITNGLRGLRALRLRLEGANDAPHAPGRAEQAVSVPIRSCPVGLQT